MSTGTKFNVRNIIFNQRPNVRNKISSTCGTNQGSIPQYALCKNYIYNYFHFQRKLFWLVSLLQQFRYILQSGIEKPGIEKSGTEKQDCVIKTSETFIFLHLINNSLTMARNFVFGFMSAIMSSNKLKFFFFCLGCNYQYPHTRDPWYLNAQ